jgi:CheY-like chemotaxis protein
MKAEEKDGYFLEYQPKYRRFRLLIRKRIVEVLLVSSIYDSFIMEEDVRLSDQIYEEFHNLNLRTLPHISRASSGSQALEMLRERKFDLVITMRRLGELDPWAFAQKVKQIQDIPVILLLNNSAELRYMRRDRIDKHIDKVFVWNGNSRVFVAIIKLLEDRMSVDQRYIQKLCAKRIV